MLESVLQDPPLPKELYKVPANSITSFSFIMSISSEILPFAASRHFSGILFLFHGKYRRFVFHQHNLYSKFNDHVDIHDNFHLNLEEIC